jgi:pyrroline-5-carboxylate reductase
MTDSSKRKEAVLLIGAGRMGGALLKGWVASKRFSAIHAVEPMPSPAVKALARGKAILLTKNLPDPMPKVCAVVLALKPQMLKGEQELLAAIGNSGAAVISIAAGVTTTFLSKALKAPVPVIRAMPNTPGAIGKGITALYASGDVKPKTRKLAEALMSALGETLWVKSESLMDAVTAVSGSGPAYVFLMAEAMAAAAREQGLDEATAEKLARATVAGAGALLASGNRKAAELRKDVTSPGGTTQAALNVLMAEGGLEPLMRRAIAAATKRGKELGKT